MDDDDDDDYERYNKYEDGHWIWNDEESILEFVSHKEVIDEEEEVIAGDELFRDDIDVLEQVVFKQKFHRKLKNESDPDIILLQDIKDVVLFTAQKQRLTRKLINSLHTIAYDKFLRNLVVYTQYYMQVRRIMEKRAADSAKMIRLPESDIIEGRLEKNLADVRSLVARDYLYAKLDGCREGKTGRIFMMSEEIKFTEMIIKISFHVVWIALMRPDLARIGRILTFQVIVTSPFGKPMIVVPWWNHCRCTVRPEMSQPEINRIFRTPQFNKVIENKIKPVKFSQFEERVFYRKVPQKIKLVYNKFGDLSPMTKDLLKYTQDYRHMGLGVLGFQEGECSRRLEFIDDILFAPEEILVKENIKIGILGEPRSKYDMMLFEIPGASKESSSKSKLTVRRSSHVSSGSKKSRSSPLANFHIPAICEEFELPSYFPELPPAYNVRPVNLAQKKRWINHIKPKKKSKNV